MIGFLAQASELMLKSMPHLSVESSNCQIGFDGLGYRLALAASPGFQPKAALCRLTSGCLPAFACGRIGLSRCGMMAIP